MIDLTSMPEVLNPLSVTQITATNVTKPRKSIWIAITLIIAVFGIIAYIIYLDSQKSDKQN